MLIWCLKTFLIILNALNIFGGNNNTSFLEFLDKLEVQNNLFQFCNIRNVFTVTFKQFNAFLLNKKYTFILKKNLSNPKHTV